MIKPLPSSAEKEILKGILKLAKKKKIQLFLVGGYLRDILLGQKSTNPDLDFCLKRGAINFTREVAKRLRAGFVVLDKERGCARVIKKGADIIYTLDFTDFRGRSLKEDLRERDFTINALALDLEKFLGQGIKEEDFFDPYGARRDLKAKIIRQLSGNAFDQDPLRILRAFSLAGQFNFKIAAKTLEAAGRKRGKLKKVSGERIRDELFKILDLPCAHAYLTQLDKLKILSLVIPEIEAMRRLKQGPYHHLDVWQHTLETVRQLDILIKELKANHQIQDCLKTRICGERKRRALIKLGALFHDIGKPKARRRQDGKTKFHGHEKIGLEMVENIVWRLRLSNDEAEALRKMVFWHLRPGYLADNQEISRRAKFRYFRDTGEECVSILLLSLADQRSTKGPLTSLKQRLHHEKIVWELIREYFKSKKEKKIIPLVNGHGLMRHFKLTPSPLIGKMLAEIEELQAIGRIKTQGEAFRAAQRLILK